MAKTTVESAFVLGPGSLGRTFSLAIEKLVLYFEENVTYTYLNNILLHSIII